MSEPRDTRAAGRPVVVARPRRNESPEQREWRQRWGRLDELAIDFVTDTAPEPNEPGWGTHRTHRSQLNSLILPVLGETWLVDCGYDALAKVLDHAGAKGVTRQEAALSMLGSLVTWASQSDVRRWPDGHAGFGGPVTLRAERRRVRRTTAADGTRGLIRHTDCPTVEQTWAFADHVRAAAIAGWGKEAAYLGEFPKVQFVTGSRIAEAIVLHSDNYSPDDFKFWIDVQWDRATPWTTGDMPTVPVKNSRPRSAQVWQWAAEEFLDDFVVQARAERDGRLFDPPTRQRRSWLPSFEAFLRDVAAQHGYPYTPHWHRHAYASLNLAPVSDGGYDKGVPKVAEWLGDTPTSVVKTYWHSVSDTIDTSWSRRRPGGAR